MIRDGDLPQLEVKLWGDFACFTRPEMKVERVTYPIMTPSAARGALEAIYWKPQVNWLIQEIHVLKPISYMSIVRNEIKNRQSHRTARSWVNEGDGYDATDTKKKRSQRHSLLLRDVAYVVRAQLHLADNASDNIAKHRDQFRRRVEQGRCFSVPYLGCREFAASFSKPESADIPIDLTEDLGLMLLDIDYAPDGSGRGAPRFFNARIEQGILAVPDRFREPS